MKTVYFVLHFLLLTFSVHVYAQKGVIRGKITDAETGEALIGANVVLLGVNPIVGAVSDVDGSYQLLNVPDGRHKIQFSYISYEKNVIENVDISSGNMRIIDAALKSESNGIDEVVIQANVVRNTENSVLVLQKKSANVIDGISSQQFSRLGDSDAASALKRVTGVTVEGGKYIFVRGLSDRYTKTGLNGAEIPGLDPNRNTVQMDLFPSNLIDNMIVHKTFSPELPGSFTGGYVDIITKDIPEKFTLLFSNSLGYNTNTSFKEILLYDGGKTDWLGIDDGTRSLPDMATGKIPALYETYNSNIRLDSITRSFNKTFSPTKKIALPNHSHSLALGNQFLVNGKTLGVLASFTYRRDFESYATGVIKQYERGQVGAKSLETMLDLTDESGSMEVLWGAMFGVTYKLASNHKIGITSILNKGGITKAMYSEGYDTYNQWIFQNRSLVFLERSFFSNQVKGDHYLPDLAGIKLNWLVSATTSGQNEPDLRFFQNVKDSTDMGEVIYSIAANQKLPVRYFREMNEINVDNKVNFEMPVSWFEENSKIKWGGKFCI